MIDAYTNHLRRVRRLSDNTVRLRRVYMRQFASACDLGTATSTEMRAWISGHPEWSIQTVNVATSTLRSFYDWAFEEGVVELNPARTLRGLRVPVTPARIARPEHLAAGISSPEFDVRVFVRLGAECGLRVHEIAKAHPRDRQDEWLTVLGKGGQTRVVHLSPQLLADLVNLEHTQGRGWYFPSPRGTGHVTAESVRQRIARATGTNPHSLRHRAATTVYHGTGRDLRLTQVFLGHASPQTTARYVHVELDDLRRASAASRLAA